MMGKREMEKLQAPMATPAREQKGRKMGICTEAPWREITTSKMRNQRNGLGTGPTRGKKWLRQE